ncbi:hypothetical protein [Mycobacteroides chelonae]|uniref:hypothetical protein n=1 Tax=Mycobacteroides chelonae TaxID=1774 RepID=UPI0004AA7B0F|nr:hypothetical protein [Mycobacteroides chelonae]OHT67783.1 hypothetical protein BKG66_24470 [Mycobacteroides chelonae]OHT69426.1 hypothetical protein BKG67_23005 [Mycobacteroides chelonae]
MNRNDIEDAIALSGSNFDDVVIGYLEAQLWAGLDLGREDEYGNNPPLDEHYDRSDIAEEYIDNLRVEIRDVVAAHPLAVRMYLSQRKFDASDGSASEHFGHDLYLTRERHGAGFWDRGLGELGTYLSRIAHDLGSAELLWDDGSGTLR